jgi:hypothetical protein
MRDGKDVRTARALGPWPSELIGMNNVKFMGTKVFCSQQQRKYLIYKSPRSTNFWLSPQSFTSLAIFERPSSHGSSCNINPRIRPYMALWSLRRCAEAKAYARWYAECSSEPDRNGFVALRSLILMEQLITCFNLSHVSSNDDMLFAVVLAVAEKSRVFWPPKSILALAPQPQ